LRETQKIAGKGEECLVISVHELLYREEIEERFLGNFDLKRKILLESLGNEKEKRF